LEFWNHDAAHPIFFDELFDLNVLVLQMRLGHVRKTPWILRVKKGDPQGLKPASLLAVGGTAEAVPFPKSIYETVY
jgi:hypothetical protein